MGTDIFADIGAREIAARHGRLEAPPPPELPDRQLPASQSLATAAFKPRPRMNTPEQLQAELAAWRRRYAPFLKDLAPELPSRRLSRRLDSFQWRLETAADQADFLQAATGKGQWTTVSIPHYGGPTGRACAYYRTEFIVTRAMLAKGALFVRFGAVDYKAQVFVNGHCLGSHEGFFAPFEFEFAAVARPGKNILLVKVENDAIYGGNQGTDGTLEQGDKLYAATGPGWDEPGTGWHHCPPGMGICQKVVVEARQPLHISDLWVRPLPEQEQAEAEIEVWNQDRKNQVAHLEISVFGQNFRQTVVKALRHVPGTRIVPGVGDLQKPTDNQEVTLTMGAWSNRLKVPLAIPKPRLWEPETPWLYQIQVKLLDADGQVLDTAKRQFGMRSFRQDNESLPRGRFLLNGREIKLRGANTMGFEQQDVARQDFDQLVDDILLAKICNMNFWRLTQRSVEPEVYDYCDRLGLMTQSDLPLFGSMRYNKVAEGIRQAEETERLVRSHPCNVVMSYINEPFPNSSGKPHRHLSRPELQAFFEACDRAVRILNPDRVIKHVDGDYDPPGTTLPDNHCYCGWYNGHGLELGRLHHGWWIPVAPGWRHACGEFGSEGLDPVALMRRRYPQEWLPDRNEPEASWTPDRIHACQTGKFHYMWFDAQATMEDWVRTSRRHQEWITRLFTERFRRDNHMVGFAIHLFIDAWPAGWMKTIMDCERQPKPAYFAYRDALEPLAVNIRTDRWKFTAGESMPFEFWICNDTHDAPSTLSLRWQIEQDGRIVFAQQSDATLQAMHATFQGFFTPKAPRTTRRTAYTIRLALCDGRKVLCDTAVDYEVFPPPAKLKRPAVAALGQGKARRLLRELGLKPAAATAEASPTERVILVDDLAEYTSRRNQLDQAVKAGARLVFLELPAGRHDIGGSTVLVEECIMRPREFVSRQTGHPLVAGFQPDDFKCWFDPDAGYFRPLLDTMFEAKGWVPILTSGNGIWGGSAWKKKLAAAEKTAGRGSYIICQVALAGRTRHNPTAAEFAQRLLVR